MTKDKRLRNGPRRRARIPRARAIGFLMSLYQRRLASSTYAIWSLLVAAFMTFVGMNSRPPSVACARTYASICIRAATIS